MVVITVMFPDSEAPFLCRRLQTIFILFVTMILAKFQNGLARCCEWESCFALFCKTQKFNNSFIDIKGYFQFKGKLAVIFGRSRCFSSGARRGSFFLPLTCGTIMSVFLKQRTCRNVAACLTKVNRCWLCWWCVLFFTACFGCGIWLQPRTFD